VCAFMECSEKFGDNEATQRSTVRTGEVTEARRKKTSTPKSSAREGGAANGFARRNIFACM
jgi:hypothetical protein